MAAADQDGAPAVPGGQSAATDKFDGPSGVLVCCEDYIVYKHQGVKDHRVPIPKRASPVADPERGVIIISAVMHKMKVNLESFHLQTA
jgi:splicing factor 3B subunit 3